MSDRVVRGIVIGIGVVILASCADWSIQGLRVRHATSTLKTKFSEGLSIADAQRFVASGYPEHTDYTAEKCEYWSHNTVPRYTSRGGPCIFGIVRTGSTWWGYESAVEFRLIFGPDNLLQENQILPVYTFL